MSDETEAAGRAKDDTTNPPVEGLVVGLELIDGLLRLHVQLPSRHVSRVRLYDNVQVQLPDRKADQ